MHCIHCGALLPESAKFCTACGKPIQVISVEPNQEPVAAEQPVATEPAADTAREAPVSYTTPSNASEGYTAAASQLPPSYSNPTYAKTSSAPAQPVSNGLAIAGFVCSLIFLPVTIGTLAAIAGLILSIMGINSAKKLPGNKGHGLAVAGTIISAIRIVIILIGIIALLALMIRGMGYAGHEIFSNWSEYMPYNF